MDRAAEEAYAAAARQAVEAFPVEPSDIALVSVSENVTFRVTDRNDGAAYVLRLHRPGYNSLAELKSERMWVEALGKAGVAAPRGLAARDGRDFVSVPIPGADQSRYAGMTSWTDGEVLAEVLERTGDVRLFERYFRQLGQVAAAIHNQSSRWRPPPEFERRMLDADGLIGEAPFWGRFWEHPGLAPDERRRLLETRERVRGALDRYGKPPSTFGLIHADLHPGNVLVDGDRLSVIDFDDAAYGWHGYEIAVALLHYQESPHFPAIRAAFLGGYLTGRAMSGEALALIPMFMLIRQMAVIGWLGQRPEIDANARFAAMRRAVCAACAAFEAPC